MGALKQGNESATSLSDFVVRERLARMVIGWSVAGIFFFAGVLVLGPTSLLLVNPTIFAAGASTSPIDRVLSTATSSAATVLPILSGWTGAVIAYYFVNKAHEEANRNTRALIDGLSFSDRLKEISVRDVQRPIDQIDAVQISRTDPNDIHSPISTLLSEVLAVVEPKPAGKARTRVPLIDSTSAVPRLIAIVHESTLFEFLRRNPASDPGSTTLQTFLDDSRTRSRLDGTLGYVSIEDSLADAKAQMDANRQLQDVVVTRSGRPGDPMIGWLTNVDVLRRCIARAALDAKQD